MHQQALASYHCEKMPMHATTSEDLSSLKQLLVEGGDSRITPALGGVNKYGCAVKPHSSQENLFAFGSATASTISNKALDAAQSVYQRIHCAHPDSSQYQLYENELEAVRQELKQLCDLNEQAGVDIIFAASGTDLHLIASQLTAGVSSATTVVVMVEAVETGSSVPAALSGRHFDEHTALGATVIRGEKIDRSKQIELAQVALRRQNGDSRHSQEIDDEVSILVRQAVRENKRVLLVLTDVTKTGLISPSIATAIRLSQQFPDQLDVMVDACQFRISNASLHAYLDQQFLVAVTGSKFLTGPSFSGALFVPVTQARRLQKLAIPNALLDYSSRADWPRAWTNADALRNTVNFGLLLRWVAALTELRAFRALSDADISNFIQSFQSALLQYFQSHPQLTLLPAPRLEREALHHRPNWDSLPTIFSFVMSSAEGKHVLNREQTMAVYRKLHTEKSMHVGQPVLCGARNGVPVSALRLCLSARLIVAAISENAGNQEKIIQNAMQVLDAASQLAAVA